MTLFVIRQRYFRRDSDQLGEVAILGVAVAPDAAAALAAVPADAVLDEGGWNAWPPDACAWGEFDPAGAPFFLRADWGCGRG